MNVFMQNSKTDEIKIAFLVGSVDFDTIVTVQFEEEGEAKGIMTFTPDGELIFTNLMQYETWNVLAMLPAQY